MELLANGRISYGDKADDRGGETFISVIDSGWAGGGSGPELN